MPLEIPTNLARSFSLIVPMRNDPQDSMAACALWGWYTRFEQARPGISAPIDKASDVTHFHEGAFSPVFVWRDGTFSAWLFSDQSLFITQTRGDHHCALPVIFRLRKETYCRQSGMIRVHSRNSARAEVSFPLQKTDVRLPSWPEGHPDLDAMDVSKSAFARLGSDIRKLAPFFQDLLPVRQPLDRSATTIEGENAITAAFLPQRWYSDTEKAAIETWSQDMADWILHQSEGHYAEVQVTIHSVIPDNINTPFALLGPLQYHYRLAQRPAHGVMTGFANIEKLVDLERTAFPVPRDRLCEMAFTLKGKRMHTSAAPRIACKSSKGQLSQHRRLEIQARFGITPLKLAA